MRTLHILCCVALALAGCATSPSPAKSIGPDRSAAPPPEAREVEEASETGEAPGTHSIVYMGPSTSAGQQVALSFELEPHVADGETILERTFRGTDRAEFHRSGVRFESVVEAVPEGFTFSRRNFQHGGDGVWGMEATIAALMEGVRVVVTPDGEFVSVQGLDGYHERVALWLEHEPRFENDEAQREAMRAYLAATGSPDHLRIEIGTEWLLFLPLWERHPFEIRHRYQMGEPPLTYVARELWPCPGGEASGDCVLVEVNLPRGLQIDALCQEVMQRLGDWEGSTVEEVEDTIQLLARVDDLRPYQLKRTRRCHILDWFGEETEWLGIEEIRTTEWSYPD